MKTFLALFLMVSFVQSGVSQDMQKMMNKLGTNSNFTRAGAYKDQSAGFYTGGSLFARNQIHNTQLMNIQLPSFRAGCGGIDMFMGSFSHISSQKLIESMKAIASNAASYAMMLALETISPQVKNTMSELNDMAQRLNQLNINSCEVAATALGSVFPRKQAGESDLCKMIGSGNQFSDYSAARQGCGAGGQRDQTINSASNDPNFKAMLGSEFNLAWKAIQENEFLRTDKNLAEFFMTVSGTIISRKEGEEYKIDTRTSMANKNTMLSAMLHGGQVKVYRCIGDDGGKCLQVGSKVMNIRPQDALVNKVKNFLTSIRNKIETDSPLSAAEISFLNSTRLPFYKIINVSTAFRRGGSPVDILDYAELGAVDVMFQYMSEILDVIKESIDHIRLSQLDDTQINQFEKSLNETRRRIVERRMGSFKQMQQVIDIVRKTELLEKSLMSKAGTLAAEGL